jgi:hypothetical protein
MLNYRFYLFFVSIVVTYAAGCSDKAVEKCKRGEIHDCTCSDEHASLQTCNASGAWNACNCGVPAGAGSGGTGSSGTGAGAGAGGGGQSGGEEDAGVSEGSADAGPPGLPDAEAPVPVEDASLPPPPYSGPCTASSCPHGQTCDATGKYCAADCTAAANCPAGSGGTASKTCVIPAFAATGKCALSCVLATCPSGMTCNVLLSTCGWP